jgi:hypothetical protein
MSDAVAIVSVVSSGVVGLGGLVTTTWGAARARRWQGREERIAELRTILDAAAAQMSAGTQALADAHDAVCKAGSGSTGHFAELAADHLSGATRSLTEMWTLWNRVRVRTGSESTIARTLLEVHRAIGELYVVVRRELGMVAADDDYGPKWEVAQNAQGGFFDAAAKELSGK